MKQRTFHRIGMVWILSLGALGASLASAAGGDLHRPAGADRPLLAAAGDDAGRPEAAESPDGMGHLPGHLQAAAGDDDAASGEHHHHAGSAEDPHSSGQEDEADACEGMAQGHGGDEHAMRMMMGGHGHAGAGGHGHEGHGHHADSDDEGLEAISAPPPPSWLHGIELSEDQQDRIFAILHESAAAQRQAHRTAERTHRQLSHIGMATDYSEASTRKLSEQHAQAISELTLLRARIEKHVLEVLTPEQRRDAAHQAARED